MKATLRLPSKAIQYGFVEVEVDVPDDPEVIGQFYVNYVHAFLESEQKGLNALLSPDLKPEDVDHQLAVKELQGTLGATVVGEEETPAKPWEKKVDAPSKPWETGGSAPKAEPKIADIDW